MKERGKAMEVTDHSFFSSEIFLCNKHPYSTSVGICAHCLKDKLVQLVCSDCGEQRLSSCSCSDISSSYRNSSSTMEIGSVGRISFLLENDQKIEYDERSSEVPFHAVLRRSSSSCVDDIKKMGKLWNVKRLFKKKQNKNFQPADCKSEVWASDLDGVSRSRSMCSTFRGCNDLGELESSIRKSGFGSNHVFDDESRFESKFGIFPVKESEFSAMDHESSFIDLKLGYSEFKRENSSANVVEAPSSDHGLRSEGLFGRVGSCRIRANGMGLIKRHRVWKWILKYYDPAGKERRKR